ncbi:MAG: hypothetical protein RSD22_09275 [Romboutsia sp.]
MSRYREYKSDKIINIILKNHFEEFRKEKWHRVRKEMREHIIDILGVASIAVNLRYINIYKLFDCLFNLSFYKKLNIILS